MLTMTLPGAEAIHPSLRWTGVEATPYNISGWVSTWQILTSGVVLTDMTSIFYSKFTEAALLEMKSVPTLTHLQDTLANVSVKGNEI